MRRENAGALRSARQETGMDSKEAVFLSNHAGGTLPQSAACEDGSFPGCSSGFRGEPVCRPRFGLVWQSMRTHQGCIDQSARGLEGVRVV